MSIENEEKKEFEKPQTGLTRRSLLIGLVVLLFWGLLTIFAGNFGEAPQILIEEMSILFPFYLLIFGLQ